MRQKKLYIIDNGTSNQSVHCYLSKWCSVSKQIDIATGYWEIGGLLAIEPDWQQVDKIRILLGNEVTKRTRDVIEETVRFMLSKIKDSVDQEQEKNEFLIGVPAILSAMRSGQIECRVYDKNKFHAKAYITYFRDNYHAKFIEVSVGCRGGLTIKIPGSK